MILLVRYFSLGFTCHTVSLLVVLDMVLLCLLLNLIIFALNLGPVSFIQLHISGHTCFCWILVSNTGHQARDAGHVPWVLGLMFMLLNFMGDL